MSGYFQTYFALPIFN